MIRADDNVMALKKAVNNTKPIELMGKKRNHGGTYKYSMFGAMTDVNMWNRTLAEQELKRWNKCELGIGGNLLDWNSARWEAVGLQETEVDIDKVCKKEGSKKNLIAFKRVFKSLDPILKMCKAMGGERVT